MTSTEFSIGMSGERNSSRVLKPPGGGHTNIFSGTAEAHVPSPRPKYDQQNSSNLNFCMNTVDPNIKVVEHTKHEVESKPAAPAPVAAAAPAEAGPRSAASAPASNGNGNAAASAPPPPQSDGGQSRGSRVPPGGFSSGGFW